MREISKTRHSLLPRVEHLIKRSLFEAGALVTPVGRGKKALVYLVRDGKKDGVVRLFNDPLRFLRYLRVYSLMGFNSPLFPACRLVRVEPGLWARGLFALSVEERLAMPRSLSAGFSEGLGRVLARLHLVKRDKWGGLFWPSKGEYSELMIHHTISRIGALDRYWGERFNLNQALRDWFLSWESRLDELEVSGYQLVHGDIAVGNTGMRGDEVVLLDIVRLRFAFALEDVVAALDMVRRQKCGDSKALESAFWEGYLPTRPLSATERELLPLFEAAFHVKRLKRAVKHLKKGEIWWNQRASWHLGQLRRIVN